MEATGSTVALDAVQTATVGETVPVSESEGSSQPTPLSPKIPKTKTPRTPRDKRTPGQLGRVQDLNKAAAEYLGCDVADFGSPQTPDSPRYMMRKRKSLEVTPSPKRKTTPGRGRKIKPKVAPEVEAPIDVNDDETSSDTAGAIKTSSTSADATKALEASSTSTDTASGTKLDKEESIPNLVVDEPDDDKSRDKIPEKEMEEGQRGNEGEEEKCEEAIEEEGQAAGGEEEVVAGMEEAAGGDDQEAPDKEEEGEAAIDGEEDDVESEEEKEEDKTLTEENINVTE